MYKLDMHNELLIALLLIGIPIHLLIYKIWKDLLQ